MRAFRANPVFPSLATTPKATSDTRSGFTPRRSDFTVGCLLHRNHTRGFLMLLAVFAGAVAAAPADEPVVEGECDWQTIGGRTFQVKDHEALKPINLGG